jgi:recombinational DNA repair ATPase RecF
MIRIETIRIQDFRGIRNLTLNLKGQNFAACGPNGTGKSGIVDAIEFALTGNISRLSGGGTGNLSVKAHGPHVDSRNKPERAAVTLEVSIPSKGRKKATIHRTVKTASAPTITPDDPDVRAAFDVVRLHPEFVLSRRELIKYVLSNPGDRAKEVQALLRLDDIEKLRIVLQRVANATSKEVPALQRDEGDATRNLLSALGIPQVSKAAVLGAVNPHRQILGLQPLTDLEATTSLKDGLATASSGTAVSRVPKAQAVADIVLFKSAMTALNGPDHAAALAGAVEAATTLSADASALTGVSRQALLQNALELYDGQACPVCDSPFQPAAFNAHVAAKLAHLAGVAAQMRALELLVQPILGNIQAAGSALATLIGHAGNLAPPIDATQLTSFKAKLGVQYKALDKLLPLDQALMALNAGHDATEIAGPMAALETAVGALPEPSKQDAARDFLVIAQERLETFRAAKQKVAVGKQKAERSAQAFAVFAEVINKALEDIYKEVETAFTAYYRDINRDDEAAFTAKLLPSIGKLGFDVDFYGRGHFPPGAYHSEGHQDGMGLCLYLALMHHLLGENFTFAVLDDVLMSVDAGHRREVCALLRKHFPNTQFIFTTHDEIWLRHMKSDGLVTGRNFAHFRTWSVDLGPTEWDDHDVWTEIDGHLVKNDVRAAAALLRHYLEHFGKEACDRLRAQVEFHGDAQFDLGDLLPNAIGALGGAYSRAKAAANSWNQQDVVAAIATRSDSFDVAKGKTSVDQWQINAAVHFNAWADLQKQDFTPLAAAYKNLIEAFSCASCKEMLSITPRKGKKEALRCSCGSINLNLIEKGK